MRPAWLELGAAFLIFVSVTRGVFWVLADRPEPTRRRPLRPTGLRGAAAGSRPAVPPNRPIEEIAVEARQLAGRVHHPPRGTSYAKYVGWRSAYDRVLAEGCRALEVEHLLGVLEPGPDLDAERDRVESLLWLAGLRIDEAA